MLFQQAQDNPRTLGCNFATNMCKTHQNTK